MNRPIRKVAIALAVLFLAIFVNLNFVQVVKGSAYRDDPQNRRVLLNEYSSPRGQIVVSGAAVAQSIPTKDELKYLRKYSDGPAFAPATGYYSFTYGTYGIEDAENAILSGDSSSLFTSKLANILTGRNPRGGSVQLTLNKDAQTAAYNAMRAANGSMRRGAVVALDPKTGAILALVSTPSYDPNALSSHNANGIAHAYSCYLDLTYPTRGVHESAGAFAARTAESIRIQLLLRKGGADAFTAATKRDPKMYPQTGTVYVNDAPGRDHAEQVSYLDQFPRFGSKGCGDVPQDPTSFYVQDPHATSPLLNSALNQNYPAGSIFKVIDSAAALKLGVKADDRIPAPNSYWPLEPKRTTPCPSGLSSPCVQNFEGEVCQDGKTATLAYALAKSCNTAFAALTVGRIGPNDLKAQAQKFGFEGPQIKTPLPAAQSVVGTDNVLSDPAALAQTSFGQRDVRVTPLQAAMLSSSVANNGTLMQPFLVRTELRPNLSVLNTTQPQQMSQVLDPTLDQQLIKMMEDVVHQPYGTGGPANITDLPSVVVGGKTGTADVGATSASTAPPDAWFTGFALVNGDPRIAVAVVVEHGGVQGNETTGGLAAGPVARQVMEAYLKATGVR